MAKPCIPISSTAHEISSSSSHCTSSNCWRYQRRVDANCALFPPYPFFPVVYFLCFSFPFLAVFSLHALSPTIDSTHSIRELERKVFNLSCPAGEHFDLSLSALSFECMSTHGACGKWIVECKAHVVLLFPPSKYLLCFCAGWSLCEVISEILLLSAMLRADWSYEKTHYRDSFVPLCGLVRRVKIN